MDSHPEVDLLVTYKYRGGKDTAKSVAEGACADSQRARQYEGIWWKGCELPPVFRRSSVVADPQKLVFAHCDLLCANCIVQPSKPEQPPQDDVATVDFIDYEYATPSPAIFDIANNFAEWIGYECDYSKIPTRSTRRRFLQEYLQTYYSHLNYESDNFEQDLDRLCADIDRFRGIPGFYWGIWALIQATISQIDFNYAEYAEQRLGEYWAWREETAGSSRDGKEKPLREQRWAME